MTKELFDSFGKTMIEYVRDSSINEAMWIINATTPAPSNKSMADVFSKMDDSQREAVKELVYHVVDSVIHNILYVFEDSKTATIYLHEEGKDGIDMRKIATGDLQGYAFEWAEKYSEKPLSFTE